MAIIKDIRNHGLTTSIPFKDIISLADSVWIAAENESSTYIDIEIAEVFTFHIDEESARDILNGTVE